MRDDKKRACRRPSGRFGERLREGRGASPSTEDCTARRTVLCLFLGLPLSCVQLPDQQFEERVDWAASELPVGRELLTFARLRSLPREGHEALLPLLASAIIR